LYLGRPLVYKFAGSRAGKLFLLSEEKIKHAEDYFIRNGRTSTFIGRLVPGVRHLISIPAGLARMNLRDFMLFTFIGAGLWNICLAVIGYYLYELEDEIYPYLGYFMLALGAGFVVWLIIKGRKKRKNNSGS
jgi:membrane protein DedA with SNARE-associated domain